MSFYRGKGLQPGEFAVDESGRDVLSHWRFDRPKNRLISDLPVEVTLHSVYFGGMHALSAAGHALFLRNLHTGVTFRSLTEGFLDQSILANRGASGVICPKGRVRADYIEVESNGALSTQDVIFDAAESIVGNTTIFGIEVYVTDAIIPTDIIYYNITFIDGEKETSTFEQEITGETVAAGGVLKWWFETAIDLLSITERSHTTMFKNKDPLYVKAGSTDINKRYTLVKLRPFEDKDLAFKDDLHDPDKIISPDGLKNLTITDNTLKYNDGTFDRISLDDTHSTISSPNGLSHWQVDNTRARMLVAGVTRFDFLSNLSVVRSPDSNFEMELTDLHSAFTYEDIVRFEVDVSNTRIYKQGDLTSYMKVNSGNMGFVQSGSNALNITSSQTKLSHHSGTSYVALKGSSLEINHAGKRVWLDNVSTELYAPNGVGTLRIGNTSLSFTDNASNERFNIDENFTELKSPDFSSSMTFNNSATLFTGLVHYDNSVVVTNASAYSMIHNVDVVIGTLTAQAWIFVGAAVTNFTVRDIDANIGVNTVRIIILDAVDELILSIPHDYVRLTKHDGVWYYFNHRNGIGQRVTT